MRQTNYVFYLLLFFLVIFGSIKIVAQETVSSLRVFLPSETIQNQHKKNARNLTTIFLVDTLNVPFVDDFTKNKIRSLRVIGNQHYADSLKFLFKINGLIADSAKLMTDTTYSIKYDTTIGNLVNYPNPQIKVFFYQNAQFPTLVTDSIKGWPNYEIYSDSLINDTTFIEPDTAFANQIDSIRFVFDSPKYLWTSNGVLLNNSFAVNPPSYGVATFDGVDFTGYPYDFASQNAYGLADELTSKPIDLSFQATDSIFLSFFYQAGGLGEFPNPEDSLTLQFYNPSTDRWNVVWSTPGTTDLDFKQVSIQISDSAYLQKGFQFRFRNYATISGSFDIWNLDYVQLDRFRRPNEVIDDLAFRAAPASYLNNYTSIPWKHYIKAPQSYVLTEFTPQMNNLSPDGKIFTNSFRVFDELNNLIYTSVPVNQPFDAPGPSAPANAPFKVRHYLNSTVQNNFIFPSISANPNRARFYIENNTNTVPDANADNDTVTTTQVFDTYLAYDDGIADQAYSLNEAGAQLAVKFQIPIEDTIKALLINFPKMLEDMSDRRFRILIWKNLNNAPIHEDILREPITTNANGFVRYVLSNPVTVNGEFYVGWIQTLPKKLYVGMDFNINSSQNIYYNVNNINWYNTSFKGSLLVRPDFGFAQIDAVHIPNTKPVNNQNVSFNLFPNPATNYITIVPNNLDEATVNIFDLTGRLILSKTIIGQAEIDLGNLKSGFYLVKLYNKLGMYQTKQFVVK